jgi:phospholipase C
VSADQPDGPEISRRRLLAGAGAGAVGLLAGGAMSRLPWPAASASALGDGPGPAGDGRAIEHIVVVMMENRSFDHFLGWLPGADGVQDTVVPRFPDQAGVLRANHHLTEPMGCGHPDPDHSYTGGRFQRNGGAMDNFARGHNDDYAIGFYTRPTGRSWPPWPVTTRPATGTSARSSGRRTPTGCSSTPARPTGCATPPTWRRCRRCGTS